ncbi:MAG: hypothetical protein HY738_04325 [Bacteroidia bacterium]|nr:hypothetical protein [Bacteroidia bacterium]
MKILFCIIILFFPHSNNAQIFKPKSFEYVDGYIITTGKDTIFGKIKLISPLRNSMEVGLISDDSTIIYYPKDIISYKIGEMPFEAINNERFMQVVAKGTLSLYILNLHEDNIYMYDLLRNLILDGPESQIPENYKLYLKKDGIISGAITKNNFINILLPYISDDLNLTMKVKNKVYSYKELPAIVSEYNIKYTFLNQKHYLNENWKETTIDSAKYFRVIEYIPSILKYKVSNYLLSGELQEENTFNSEADIIINDAIKGKKPIINLSGFYLETIPESLFQVKFLEQLDLSCTGMKFIPSEIGLLNNLISINFSHNLIAQVPDELAELKNLKSLNLSYNLLSDFPKAILSLKNLVELNLSFNYISEIPSEIGNLSELEYLSFMVTNINKIPDEITKLKKLKETDITWNFKLSRREKNEIKRLLLYVK